VGEAACESAELGETLRDAGAAFEFDILAGEAADFSATMIEKILEFADDAQGDERDDDAGEEGSEEDGEPRGQGWGGIGDEGGFVKAVVTKSE